MAAGEKRGSLDHFQRARYAFDMLRTGGNGAQAKRLLLASSLLVTASCSLVFDFEGQQCTSPEDCAALGAENASCVDSVCVADASTGGAGGSGAGPGTGGSTPDPRWDCIADFTPPETGETVEHFYRFEDALTEAVPVNLDITLCQILDNTCATPLDTPAADANGALALTLSASQEAYLTVTADGLMPAYVLLQKPVKIPQTEKVIRMASEMVLSSLAENQGADYDPTKGVTIVLASNCLDERAAGVKIFSQQATDGGATSFYFQDEIPILDATETDEQGAGGFINLPTTFIDYVIRRADTDEEIGSAQMLARAGSITYLPIGPTVKE
jgi:hypothetical protein